MPPIPIERMNGSGRRTMLSSPTATVEPGDDHRPARVRHRLRERGLGVLARASSSRKRKIISSA